MGEQLQFANDDYRVPCLGEDGAWGTVAARAVRDSLRRGSLDGVMDVLGPMKGADIAGVLREVGFSVSRGLEEKGRDAILESVQRDLIAAVDLRVDGFELSVDRRGRREVGSSGQGQSFAAKDVGRKNRDFAGPVVGFPGDARALQMIQSVMQAEGVSVELLGNSVVEERSSLLFVAGQAMQRGFQGFGFDGIPGKYQVTLSMEEMVDLHRAAAVEVAVESARVGLDDWVGKGKVSELSEWIPDSVQRLYRGSMSQVSAAAIVKAIEGGMIGKHAGEIGAHTFSRMVKEQGFDVDAPSIEVQAKGMGVEIVEPDRNRGVYVGPVVGVDHRAALVKYSRDKGVELAYEDLKPEQARPHIGDSVQMRYRNEKLSVNVTERGSERVWR